MAEKDNSNNKDSVRRMLAVAKLVFLLLIIIGVPVFLYVNYRDTLFNREWLSNLPDHLGRYKNQAALILAGLQCMQVIICLIPGQPIQFAASYMFGVFKGLLLSVGGAVVGATAAFYIARLLGRESLHLIFGEEKIEDYRRKLNSGRGLMAVLLIYLVPGIPKDLVAYAAGVSEMRFRYFIVLSSIGRIPGMTGSLLTGYFFSKKNYMGIAALGIACGVILLICFLKRRDLMAMLDRLEADNTSDTAAK